MNVYLHLCRQQPEMDNQNVDTAYPGKILRMPMPVLFVPASQLACHWMCDSPRTGYARRLTTIYVARTNEDLSPCICNVCEFLGTNYCMPTLWLTGPLQKISPLGSNLWLRHWLEGGTFRLAPGRFFPMSGPWFLVRKFCIEQMFVSVRMQFHNHVDQGSQTYA